jgi:hypothetical protein
VLFGLQAFNQESDQFSEFLHLFWPKRFFEYFPITARHFGIEFAKELDAFGAQANQDAAAIIVRRHALYESARFEAIQIAVMPPLVIKVRLAISEQLSSRLRPLPAH